MKLKTFQDMGLSFPLFLAPAAHAEVDRAGSCEVCGEEVPVLFSKTCYGCFRAGKSTNVVDTELGMVRHEDAEKGLTHGVPLSHPSNLPEYDVVPHPVDPNFPNDRWYHVRIARDYLEELIRTPRYRSIQGERWLFCCRRPCAFLGALPSRLIPKNGISQVEAISEWLRDPDWEKADSRDLDSHIFYLFRCVECGTIRFNDDCD
jgi:hypothetical protein